MLLPLLEHKTLCSVKLIVSVNKQSLQKLRKQLNIYLFFSLMKKSPSFFFMYKPGHNFDNDSRTFLLQYYYYTMRLKNNVLRKVLSSNPGYCLDTMIINQVLFFFTFFLHKTQVFLKYFLPFVSYLLHWQINNFVLNPLRILSLSNIKSNVSLKNMLTKVTKEPPQKVIVCLKQTQLKLVLLLVSGSN